MLGNHSAWSRSLKHQKLLLMHLPWLLITFQCWVLLMASLVNCKTFEFVVYPLWNGVAVNLALDLRTSMSPVERYAAGYKRIIHLKQTKMCPLGRKAKGEMKRRYNIVSFSATSLHHCRCFWKTSLRILKQVSVTSSLGKRECSQFSPQQSSPGGLPVMTSRPMLCCRQMPKPGLQ